jgi:hypothetical protein
MTIKGDSSPAEPVANHQVLWLKNWTAADIHQEYPLNPLTFWHWSSSFKF